VATESAARVWSGSCMAIARSMSARVNVACSADKVASAAAVAARACSAVSGSGSGASPPRCHICRARVRSVPSSVVRETRSQSRSACA